VAVTVAVHLLHVFSQSTQITKTLDPYLASRAAEKITRHQCLTLDCTEKLAKDLEELTLLRKWQGSIHFATTTLSAGLRET
jgi:hypothetical protein